MKLSVLIPVYNEEMTIGELIERVARVDVFDILECKLSAGAR